MLATYLILIGYFIVLMLIGVYASRHVKDIMDYYVGGKRLGYWVVAFSSRATGSSAWLLLGLTGMGAVYGIHAFWVAIGTTGGVFISWFLMAPKFKKLTDRYNSITIPDFLVSHFKASGHTLRILSATALSLFVVIYVSSQIDATGTAFESFLGWNYFTGAIVGFLIVVVYMLAGGFLAVAWSDVFQGAIMLAGLLLLPFAAFFALGGWDEAHSSLQSIDEGLLNIWGSGGFNGINLARAAGFALIGLGYLGAPQLFVRFMSIKSPEEIHRGKWISLILQFIMNVSAVSLGILGRALLTKSGQAVGEVLGNGGQDVLILLAEATLPLLLTGLYIAAVLAAIMSTIDSLLVLASSAVTRDFYQQVYRPSVPNARLSKLSRWVTLGLALLSLLVAMAVAVFSPTRTIFWFVIFGWSGLAASFCPVMVLSLFWKKFNEQGAIAAMIVGFLGVPFFKFVGPTLPVIGVYFSKLAELFPSFLLALLAGWLATILSSKGKES